MSNSILPTFKHWKMLILYDKHYYWQALKNNWLGCIASIQRYPLCSKIYIFQVQGSKDLIHNSLVYKTLHRNSSHDCYGIFWVYLYCLWASIWLVCVYDSQGSSPCHSAYFKVSVLCSLGQIQGWIQDVWKVGFVCIKVWNKYSLLCCFYLIFLKCLMIME